MQNLYLFIHHINFINESIANAFTTSNNKYIDLLPTFYQFICILFANYKAQSFIYNQAINKQTAMKQNIIDPVFHLLKRIKITEPFQQFIISIKHIQIEDQIKDHPEEHQQENQFITEEMQQLMSQKNLEDRRQQQNQQQKQQQPYQPQKPKSRQSQQKSQPRQGPNQQQQQSQKIQQHPNIQQLNIQKRQHKSMLNNVTEKQNEAFNNLLRSIKTIYLIEQSKINQVTEKQDLSQEIQQQQIHKRKSVSQMEVNIVQNEQISNQLEKEEVQKDQIDKLKSAKQQLQGMANQETEQYITQSLYKQQQKHQKIKSTLQNLQRRKQTVIKESFQLLKDLPKVRNHDKNTQSKIVKELSVASSKKKSESESQINFDVTMRSKGSKLVNFSKQDSLTYSAATDFGLMDRSDALQRTSEPKKLNDLNKQQRKSASNKALRKISDDQIINEQPNSILYVKKSESKQIINSIPFNPNISEEQKDQQDNKQQENSIAEAIDFEKTNQNKSEQQEMQSYQQFTNPVLHQKQKKTNEISQSAIFENKESQKLKAITRKRVQTEIDKSPRNRNYSKDSLKKYSRVDTSRVSGVSSKNIFSTQISNYQHRIAKIREVKEMKRRKLEQQLAKVNFQIETLKKKQEEFSPNNSRSKKNIPNNNYSNRIQISNDLQAQVKAQNLVKNLRHQKKNRNIAKLGQFKSLDKNIVDYMEQLAKLRQENQQKLKQKKKLQILQRMKQKQIQKFQDRKKKQESANFVSYIKGSAQQSIRASVEQIKPQIKKRSPTKKTEIRKTQFQDYQSLTPQLSQKKAYLHRVRNLSNKKGSVDIYEQVLG